MSFSEGSHLRLPLVEHVGSLALHLRHHDSLHDLVLLEHALNHQRHEEKDPQAADAPQQALRPVPAIHAPSVRVVDCLVQGVRVLLNQLVVRVGALRSAGRLARNNSLQ